MILLLFWIGLELKMPTMYFIILFAIALWRFLSD